MPQGQLCDAEMERVSGLLVEDLMKKGLPLDYAPESLVGVDRLLAGYGSAPGNGGRNSGLVELVGAYFGEVVRRNLGGHWYEKVPPDGATGLLVNDKADFWVWCHAIVHKQLEQGGKSLHAIYTDLTAISKDCR
jgi:hypothetical protein